MIVKVIPSRAVHTRCPYVLSLAALGIPILGLEFLLGQVERRGAVRALAAAHPRAWGIGACSLWAIFLINAYYNVLMAYAWLYLAHSFTRPLPWGDDIHSSAAFFYGPEIVNRAKPVSPPWSPGTTGLGQVQWRLVLATAAQWALTALCTLRGFKTTGAVVLATVPLPAVMLVILVAHGCTRRGSELGVDVYVNPSGAVYANGELWKEAAGQIFFTLGIGGGIMIAYGSGQPRHRPTVANTWTVALCNSGFSIIAGFAVFSYLGHFAHESGQSMDSIAAEAGGIGLSFIVFPAVLATLPASNFFSVVFFLMLVTLGLDSAMSMVEAIATSIKDRSAWAHEHPERTTLVVCTVGLAVSLIMTTRGGLDVLSVIDYHTANYGLVLAGLLETAAVGWLYPVRRLAARAEALTGEPAWWLPVAWPMCVRFITPLLLAALLAANLREETVRVGLYGSQPAWVVATFGWALSVGGCVALVLTGLATPVETQERSVD